MDPRAVLGSSPRKNDMPADDSAIDIYYREYEAMSRWLAEQEQQRKKRVKRMKGAIALSVMAFLGVIGLGVGIGWFSRANDLAQEKVFAPREEQVRRDVFEKSKAYNDGMQQELYELQRDYVKAEKPEQKAALRSIILHKVDGYDANQLPSDLQSFVRQLRSAR